MATLGDVLPDEVLRLYSGMAGREARWPLAAVAREIYLPFRDFPSVTAASAEVDRLRAEAAQAGATAENGSPGSQLWWAERRLALVKHYRGQTGMTTEIQALRIGERILVSIPGELFVEWGLELKRRARAELGAELVLVGLGNDLVGYIPSRQAFEEGCYETTLWSLSKLVPEAGQMIVDEALALASGLVYRTEFP